MKLRSDIRRGQMTTQLETIKHLREAKNIRQCDMAKYLGVHKDTYIKKENGVTQFYIIELLKLVLILDCNLEDIFS